MPTSKELLEMANTEWMNREERKGIHNQLCSETRRISWVSGWISGYLTRNPQAEREKVLDYLDEWVNSGENLTLFKWELREVLRKLRGKQGEL